MTGVTHDLAAGNAVIADNLDTNFADVVSLATSVGNAQLAGNITYDKLTDRYGLMVVSQEILPFSSGADWSTGVGFTVPTSATRVKVFAPTIKPGWEAALCAIKVYIEEADVAGTTQSLRGAAGEVGDAAQDIATMRADMQRAMQEHAAVFRDGQRLAALSNACAHQNGPLGEVLAASAQHHPLLESRHARRDRPPG